MRENNKEDLVSKFFDEIISRDQTVSENQTTKSVCPKVSKIPFHANEAINELRGKIQLSGYGIKVISVTSALANEGKSSIAFRLAKSMAELGKRVLYLDSDIRNSHVLFKYKIRGKKEGLTEYLCGTLEKEDIIYSTDDKYLDMIFSGAVAPNPSVLVSDPRFLSLINYLREIYDYIIVDTPPLLPVIDGLIISEQCDGAVLVVESRVTVRKMLEKAMKELAYADVRILGAVLNKVELSDRRYGYGKYGKYGKYGYGEYVSETKKQSFKNKRSK